MTDAQVTVALDELAPPNVRGKHEMSTFLNVICLKPMKRKDSTTGQSDNDIAVDPCSECSGVSVKYERATIVKYGNTDEYTSVSISFHLPECENTKKAPDEHSQLH